MTINASSGSKLFIGSPNQDRNTVLGTYQADTYVEVGEIEDLGEFGDESQVINFTSLSDARVRKLKGPRDAGTMALQVGDDLTDAGQAELEAAEAQNLNYNFFVELNDKETVGGNNSRHYFIGMVMGKKRNVGNASNVVKRMFNIGINSAITSTPST